MMTHNGGSTCPENVAPGGTSYKNLSDTGIAEESSSEDDDIPPSTQSPVSGDGSGTPGDTCVTTVIYKVQDKNVKGTLSRVSGVHEDVNEDSQADEDANNANNDFDDSQTIDGHHANNLNNNNNNSDKSIPDENLVDQDVPAVSNEFPLDQNADQVEKVVVIVKENQPAPSTDPLAVLEKLYVKEKSGDYKRSVSVGVSEAENTEEEVVSPSDISGDVSGDVVEEHASAESGTSALKDGNSSQVAQETSYDAASLSEMAGNHLTFMKLARSKVPPIECSDKSTHKYTELYLQTVLSQSTSYYSSVTTRTPQEDTTAAVIVTDLQPTLVSVYATTTPIGKEDTSAHHRFQKPETVKYSALAAHAPFKLCYPKDPHQPVYVEDAYHKESWQDPKLFPSQMGEVDMGEVEMGEVDDT